MNKVKLVIEMDEEVYKTIENTSYIADEKLVLRASKKDLRELNAVFELINALRNGTPLPKDFSLEDYERYKKDSESLSWIKYPDRMGN